MALYLPKQHIVIDVVDDPRSPPADPYACPGRTGVPVTCDELAQPELISEICGLPFPHVAAPAQQA